MQIMFEMMTYRMVIRDCSAVAILVPDERCSEISLSKSGRVLLNRGGSISILIVSSSCSSSSSSSSSSLELLFPTQLSFSCAALSSFCFSFTLKQLLHVSVSLSHCLPRLLFFSLDLFSHFLFPRGDDNFVCFFLSAVIASVSLTTD